MSEPSLSVYVRNICSVCVSANWLKAERRVFFPFRGPHKILDLNIAYPSYSQQWCERNKQCQRRHLSELLVAPLHKLTRYPLLLKNIWKNMDTAEKAIVSSIKEKVEKSISK